jgi:hypothetical protein
MKVGDERRIGGKRWVAAEDVNVGANAAKPGDSMLDEWLAGELEQGFVGAHAGAAAARENVAGDGERDGHFDETNTGILRVRMTT